MLRTHLGCVKLGVATHTNLGKRNDVATNLAIDPALIERARELSGERTKKAAVTRALEEFIARREQCKLLELFNSMDWDPSYDYKAERSRR